MNKSQEIVNELLQKAREGLIAVKRQRKHPKTGKNFEQTVYVKPAGGSEGAEGGSRLKNTAAEIAEAESLGFKTRQEWAQHRVVLKRALAEEGVTFSKDATTPHLESLHKKHVGAVPERKSASANYHRVREQPAPEGYDADRVKKRIGTRNSVPVTELKTMVHDNFFDKAALQFFNSRVESGSARKGINDKLYFMTSEQMDSKSPRNYTVRAFNPANGSIDTVGEFNKLSRNDADALLSKKLVRSNHAK